MRERRRFFVAFAVFDCRLLRRHPLPLPLGEVAELREAGEGKQVEQKETLFPPCRVRVCGSAFAEPRKPCGCGKSGMPSSAAGSGIPLFPSQSPAVTALPEGEPRGCTLCENQQSIKNDAG